MSTETPKTPITGASVLPPALPTTDAKDVVTEGTASVGNPVPPAPSNEPPVDEAKAKEAAEKEAADKAAAEAADKETAGKEGEGKEGEGKDGEGEEKPAELDTTVWGDTGSEVGNSALTLIQNAGVTTDEAKALLFDAVQSGDITKIDKAALEEKVGKANATLVLAGVKGFITETAEKNAGIRSQVFEAAGGESQWNTMLDWSKTAGVDLSEYAPLIDAGGAQARYAVTEIMGKYNADPKNTQVTVKPVTREEPSTSAAPAVKPLTRAEYVTKLEKAVNSGASQREIDTITAARRAGRAQGI